MCVWGGGGGEGLGMRLSLHMPRVHKNGWLE